MIPALYLAAGGAVVAAALGFGAARMVYKPRVDAARSDAATAWAKVELQSKSILNLRDAQKQRDEETARAVAAAQKKAKSAQALAKSLQDRPLPPGKNACEAACDLLREPLDLQP